VRAGYQLQAHTDSHLIQVQLRHLAHQPFALQALLERGKLQAREIVLSGQDTREASDFPATPYHLTPALLLCHPPRCLGLVRAHLAVDYQVIAEAGRNGDGVEREKQVHSIYPHP